MTASTSFFHPKVAWNLNSLPENFLWSPSHDSTFKKDVFQSLSCMYPTLCKPGFPVLHHLPEFAQTHVHWVSDAIQPSYPLSSPSPPAFRLSPASGSFPMSRLFSSGSQSIEAMCKARLGVLLSVGRGLWVQIQIALTLKVRFFLCCFLGRMGIQICNGYVIELSHVEIYI